MKKWIISLLIIIALCGIRFYDVWILDVLRLKALDSHQRQQQTEIAEKEAPTRGTGRPWAS